MSTFQRIALACIGLYLVFSGNGGVIPDIIPSPEPEGLWVLIVEEVDNRTSLEPGVLNVMFSADFRDAVEEAGGELYVWDDDQSVELDEPEPWATMLADEGDVETPRLVVHTGENSPGVKTDLPDTVDAAIAIVKEYAE